MKVRDIMRQAPCVIDSFDSLGDAYELMRAYSIRHLPVVQDGKLIGMLSERDLLEYRATLGFGQDWRQFGVIGVMSRSPRTAGPDDSITEVAGRLAGAKIGALPVVERGALLGIITVTDVLDAEVQLAMESSPQRTTTASDMMTPGPFTTRPEETLLDAARRMRAHGVRHLPVVDGDDHVLGMLSERDLRSAIGDPARFALQSASTAELHVRDVMTTPPVTVNEDLPLPDIARIFEKGAIGALPVLDRASRLVGIVSYVDALHALSMS